ncbi:crystallin J1B-like [Asterias rubens]|uniref:crystallin J1B-like n=1 Tax=Asterias rubens TaxID=7604 RepID=UPI00145535E2|nr:crystallin J1B-like [Asterias rubens]
MPLLRAVNLGVTPLPLEDMPAHVALEASVDVPGGPCSSLAWKRSTTRVCQLGVDLLDLPGAFQSALHSLINHTDLAAGVRTTIMAGGCNASRSGFIGSCLGARNGSQGIPETWKSKTFSYSKVLELSQKLVAIKLPE